MSDLGRTQLPGAIRIPEIEYVYIEAKRGELRKVMDGIMDVLDERGWEPDGGILSQNVELRMPSGKVLQAFSVSGDIQVWLGSVREYALKAGRLLARIEGDEILLDGGERMPIDRCSAERYSKLGRQL